MFDCLISIDCGLKGAICVSEKDKLPVIYPMPVKKIEKSGKTKNVYDIEKIVDIFRQFNNKKVIVAIEKQGVRPGEGAVSAMTIGEGYGVLKGISYALLFDVIIIMPQTWKKQFSDQLETAEMVKIKEQISALKLLKDKESKKSNKKEIEKLGRLFKTLAKDQSRSLAAKLMPALKESFEKKKDDGIAESLLIGIAIKKMKESGII